MIFALSMSAFAQSSSDDDDWLSVDSPKPAASDKPASTYDGTSDSEFAKQTCRLQDFINFSWQKIEN